MSLLASPHPHTAHAPPYSGRPDSENWQERFFCAADGFLLYYESAAREQPAFFDTRPKGALPLAGSGVERVYRGPPGSRWGLKVSHPALLAGRVLLLGTGSEEEQRAWEAALRDGARVSADNAQAGAAFRRAAAEK